MTVRKTAHVLATLAFLLGLAGEAYGPHAGLAHGPPAHAHDTDRGRVSQPASSSGASLAWTQATEPQESEEPDPAPCTCVGTCHGAAAAPVPARPYASVVSGERFQSGHPVATDRIVPLQPPYLLPYANAPPSERNVSHV